MFKDLKKGYQVYTLDTSGVPKFFMGTVVNVSEPRFAQSQLGQYQQLQDRVIDLTIEVDGKSMTYVVPENQNVAMASDSTSPTRFTTGVLLIFSWLRRFCFSNPNFLIFCAARRSLSFI